MGGRNYKPSEMWMVVADRWNARKLSSAGLGIARATTEEEERLYGTNFVALFSSRAVANSYVKGLPKPWPGLRVIPVVVTERA